MKTLLIIYYLIIYRIVQNNINIIKSLFFDFISLFKKITDIEANQEQI